jgi:hypothetical protein
MKLNFNRLQKRLPAHETGLETQSDTNVGSANPNTEVFGPSLSEFQKIYN